MLVTSTAYEMFALAQLYRDRADTENTFDELKNQWGWGGFTTQDLARCRLMARMVALIYNWWTLFVRLAQPHKHFEAISSRPLLLHGVATQTHHAGHTRLTITSLHAKRAAIQAVLTNLADFLRTLKATAEQWTDADRLRAILTRAFATFMLSPAGPPALLSSEIAPT
ncbi:MAG: transposase [Nitrospira sp.]|nr:transposase [Nitrospira sp.]